MIHNNRKNQKKQSGITLVALVVTIVILIILATITINVVFDDGGLIDIVKGTKDDAEDLVQSEDKKMNDLLQEYANIMGENVEIPEPEPEVDKTPPIVTVTSGGTTTNSITVNVQATDNESGMKENPTYTYYIKKSSEADSSYQVKATDVTNASYTFIGLQQATSYDIKVEVNGDKSGNVGKGYLQNQVTGKITGGITFGGTKWSNGEASITVSTSTGNQIQYQVNGTSGSWTNIENEGTITGLQHGQTVYARLYDETNYGETVNQAITDTVVPVVTVTAGGTTTNSITVSVQAVDNESGMVTSPTYTYYIKKTSEGDGSYQAKATNITNASYTFTGLEQETSYDVKVEVKADNAGNAGSGVLTNQVTTKVPDGGIDVGAITFGNTTWSGGKASITVSTNTGMQIQYQVNSTSGSWTNISNNGTVGNLQHSQTVYARLTDGTNYGDYASASIVDGTAPTVSSITTGTITYNSIQVTVSASDGQSGLATSNTYKYYLNGTLKSTQTSNSYTFTGLTAETQYTIKVEAFDKAGNKGTKSITAGTTSKTVENTLKAGDYVTYPSPSGNLACRVLYDSSSGYGVQLITSDTVTDSYTLGTSGDFDGNKTLYNKVISTLNSAVSSYNNSTYGTVRCVGSVPNNPSQDSAGYFTSSYSYMSSYNGQFKNTDTNYTTDYNQMGTLGIRNIGKSYWLASRSVGSYSSYSIFFVRIVDSSGSLSRYNLCRVYSGGSTDARSTSNGLRPVFTLKSDIKVTGGNGTSDSPYTIGA